MKVASLTGPGGEVAVCRQENSLAVQQNSYVDLYEFGSWEAPKYTVSLDDHACFFEDRRSGVAFAADGSLFFAYHRPSDPPNPSGVAAVRPDGSVAWTLPLPLDAYANLELSIGGDGQLYVVHGDAPGGWNGTGQDALLVLDPATGQILGLRTGDTIGRIPNFRAVPVDGGIGVPTFSGVLYAAGTDVAIQYGNGAYGIGGFGPDDALTTAWNVMGVIDECRTTVTRLDRAGIDWNAEFVAPYQDACWSASSVALPDAGSVVMTYAYQPGWATPLGYYERRDASGALLNSGTGPHIGSTSGPQGTSEGKVYWYSAEWSVCGGHSCLLQIFQVMDADSFESERLVWPRPGEAWEAGVDTPVVINDHIVGVIYERNLAQGGEYQLSVGGLHVPGLGTDYQTIRYYEKIGGSPPPTEPPWNYVALGDSFSSGEGTGVYDGGLADKCHRGPVSWPRLLDQTSAEVVSITHRACTGAKTQHVVLPYLKKDEPPQLPTDPNPDVNLVTITIGGNDVGFSGILIDCFFSNCGDVPQDSGFLRKLNALERTLTRVIYPAIEDAYPNARIVHVGYPRMTPPMGDPLVNCGWLAEDQDAAVTIVALLNGVISRATEASDRVEYLSVTDALQDHELCTKRSWVHAINPPFYGTASEQGHPNAKGQVAYLRAVAVGLGIEIASG